MEPKIRLKGFSGEWKNQNIGSLGTTYAGLSGKTKEDFGEGDAMYITFLNVLNNAEIKTSLLEPVNVSLDERQNEVRKGDLLFNTSSECPEEVGMCSTMGENLKRVFLNSFCFGYRPYKDAFDSLFFSYLMRSHSGRKLMTVLAQGATRYNLSKSNFCKSDMCFPDTIDEQKLIASYFQHLDSLIQSTTKKIESLKQVKTASLQSMFPQEGETSPRVRFKGFEGEWEKIAIKDIASFSKGRGYSKSDLREVGIPIILYGRLYTKYEVCISNVDTYVTLIPNSVLSNGDEVIMPASGETPEDISIASAVLSKGIILGGDLNVMRFDNSKNNTTFVALSLSLGKAKKDLSNMAQGKSVVHLHNSDIEKISIPMPSIKEQTAIASYFTNLDSQISLQTQRLEKLKQIKSACLDNMFV